jgi:bacterioferritin
MAQKAREIVGPKVDELIADLLSAYADEWLAHYYYKLAAALAEGINSGAVEKVFSELAAEEAEHADELAERIIHLGAEPITDFADIVKLATYKKVTLPSDTSDYVGYLKAGIAAERAAIEVYNRMLLKLRDDVKDPVTFHLIRHIMGEEIVHEDKLETLLGR